MGKTEGEETSKRMKTALVATAISVAAVFAAIILAQIVNGSRPENRGVLVYRRGGETVVRLDGKETVVSDAGASEFKYDEDAGRLFYVSYSACSDGLYDLYYAEKKSGALIEPRIIDSGVEKAFDVVDGDVYYLKRNFKEGANDGCVCRVDENKIETFSGNVEEIFPIKGGGALYFTRPRGAAATLYKYSNGSVSETRRDVTRATVYNGSDGSILFFERKSQSGSGKTELYAVRRGREPELVCDDVFSVMYDEYEPSGNLYYFTSSDKSVSWSYVIADGREETDGEIIRPVKKDFLSFFGISTRYNEALKEYRDKLTRDEIRAALNETAKASDFSAPVFSAFAYNFEGTFKIAQNIDPKSVYAVSAFGEPKIIFESSKMVPSGTTMSSLVGAARKSSMKETVDYARSILKKGVRSDGTAFAAYGPDGAVSYKLDGYDKERTLFSFSRDGKRIYAFVRDGKGERLDIYANGISSKLVPSERVSVDGGVSSYRVVDDRVLYLKTDVGKNVGDVYFYDGVKNVKLANAANAFTAENAKDIIVLKNHNVQSARPTADYYICSESGEKLIKNDVIVSSFNYADPGRTAFIVGDGGLYAFANGKVAKADDFASEILLFE